MNWLNLFSWTWLLERMIELAGRRLVEAYGPLVSQEHPWDLFSEKQNRRLLRIWYHDREKLRRIELLLGIWGFPLGDAPGRFSLTYVNQVNAVWGLDPFDSWFSEDLFPIFENVGIEEMIAPPVGWPLSEVWWFPFLNKLLWPPTLYAGMVLWQLRRLRTLSMLVDLKHPEIFRHLER